MAIGIAADKLLDRIIDKDARSIGTAESRDRLVSHPRIDDGEVGAAHQRHIGIGPVVAQHPDR